MARFVNPQQNESIFEIGPGLGALTEHLLVNKHVYVAVEYDRKLYNYLNSIYGNREGVEFINNDILKENLETHFKNNRGNITIVGNIPYNLTHKILDWLIKYSTRCGDIYLTIQKEMASRLTAKINSKDYSRLSVNIQSVFQVKKLFDIPAHLFYPKPKVDSSFVNLKIYKPSRIPVKDQSFYFEIIKKSFAKRRKMLKNNLTNEFIGNAIITSPLIEKTFKKLAISLRARAEDLTVEQYFLIVGEFYKELG